MTTVAGDDSVGGTLTRVTDLRGRSAATADQVLADPTGRRARRLRLGGRMLAAVFSMWLCALVLAGLGAFPVNLPRSGVTRTGQAPPNIRSTADPNSSRVTVSHGRVSAERRAQAGAPGHQVGSAESPGASTSAPGHETSPGGSPSAPGAGAPTTASTGRGALGSASHHAGERTTGSGTSPG
jgi:hypothetical protein